MTECASEGFVPRGIQDSQRSVQDSQRNFQESQGQRGVQENQGGVTQGGVKDGSTDFNSKLLFLYNRI